LSWPLGVSTELRKQGKTVDAQGMETLSTVVMLRILGPLSKPLLIKHRMSMVRDIAEYVRCSRVDRAGFCVLSSPGSAIICFPVGEYYPEPAET
jgi:serine palmitoyltransferase